MTQLEACHIQEISTHSVDMYCERILSVNSSIAGEELREYCREKIEETVVDPEIIYNKEKEEGGCPIHIRGDIAVPVRPAEENPDKVVVPTTYPKETYI